MLRTYTHTLRWELIHSIYATCCLSQESTASFWQNHGVQLIHLENPKRNAMPLINLWHRMMIIGQPTSWFSDEYVSSTFLHLCIILCCGGHGFFDMHSLHSPHKLYGVTCCVFHIATMPLTHTHTHIPNDFKTSVLLKKEPQKRRTWNPLFLNI